MEIITKVIGSAVVSLVLLAPIFLLAVSILDRWDVLAVILFATITFFEWLGAAIIIYNPES